jgi:hypothetical protein
VQEAVSTMVVVEEVEEVEEEVEVEVEVVAEVALVVLLVSTTSAPKRATLTPVDVPSSWRSIESRYAITCPRVGTSLSHTHTHTLSLLRPDERFSSLAHLLLLDHLLLPFSFFNQPLTPTRTFCS